MKVGPFRNVTLAMLVLASVIIGLMPLTIMAASPNQIVSQSERFQLNLVDNVFDHPGEAVVNVSTLQTMRIGEGVQNVNVTVQLFKQGNVTGFRLVKLDCYLGTLENYHFHSDVGNFKIFDYVGDNYQTDMGLYPSHSSNEARIQISLNIEVLYEDGHTSNCDFATQPIFGFYHVQDRHLPIMAMILAAAIGLAAFVQWHRKF